MPGRRSSTPSNAAFLQGGGDMGARMRAFDWTHHPLGKPDAWPQSLKSAVSICLGSRFPILIWWGPDLLMLYNDGYRPMLGTEKHPAALGQPGRECWSEIWDIIRPMLEDTVLRRGEATWSNDQMLPLTRNGFVEECYFTFTYSPIRDESGGVGGVFCAVIETTDRVVGERRLRLLTDLAAATAAASDAVDVCARAVSVIAHSPGDLPFARIHLFDEEDDGRVVASTASGPANLPARLSRDEARTLQLSERAVMVPIAAAGQSTPAGVLIAGLNAQRPLDVDYHSFLGLVARQIGSAIAEVRALEAEKKRAEALAELDQAKTAFFSNVSHEFRTPLTLMLGAIQDALASPSRALSDDALATVNRNALRLLKLVNTLLDFARLEAGRAEASYEATDLAAFTSDLAAAFRSAVESAGLRFDVNCPPVGEPVYVDRSMWEKVVFNLLSNALKFTFEGTIALSLAREGDQVLLSVRDTGVGIAADQLPRVFERFHRVRGARGRTHEGTGIGLSLVQELVRIHGGHISADSVVDQGTTFTVSLPLGAGHIVADSIGAPRSLSPTSLGADAYVREAMGWTVGADPRATTAAPASTGHRPRILLADDNADMRAYVSRLLGERWDVETAADGEAALAAIRERKPDVVLSDVMMPGLDGFQLLAAVRADETTREIPVVLVSARAGEEATLGAVRAGADDYLVKPFTARDLLARVDAQLLRAQAQAAARDRMAQVESLLNQIAASEQRFRAFVTATSDVVYRMSADWTRMHHLDGGSFVSDGTDASRTWLDKHVHADDRAMALDAMRAAIRDRRIFELEHRSVREDGAPGWTLSRAIPILDARGEIVEWLGTSRDVTSKKQAEETLRQSEQALAEANRVKDEFLATLSHELRTPLNAVLGWAQMLRTGALRPELRGRALESLERNAKAQAQLVDDLLDVSRIMSGKLPIRTESVDLASIIVLALESVRPAAAAKGLNVHAGIDPHARIVVNGDAGRLQQILWNLLSNAVKFTSPGGTVDVDLRADGACAEIAVRDTGDGIDAAFLPHVFERFRQAESGPARRHGGLGLGLAIVRHLTEAHGGTVSAHSDGKGTGATFIVRFPATIALEQPTPAVEPGTTPGRAIAAKLD